MPAYAFPFRDQRGNDLVAYLASLSDLCADPFAGNFRFTAHNGT
jgi:hypothetical protein